MSVETAAEDGDETRQLARELGQAIAERPEYRTFLEAKRAVEDSSTAQEQIREFEQLREEFVVARQTGEATSEDLETLQAAQESLHEVPVVREYLEAQAGLERVLESINAEISEPLAIDFGEKAGGCCQD